MPSDANLTNEFFQVRRHGDVAVVVPSPQVEDLPETLLQPAAEMVLAPLKEDPPNNIIVDLSAVTYRLPRATSRHFPAAPDRYSSIGGRPWPGGLVITSARSNRYSAAHASNVGPSSSAGRPSVSE